ncbi:MAG TPA: S53 family peptidase [Terriglobales bacterium]|nr:S53 family peptidase [Terriglobales bacterium]
MSWKQSFKHSGMFVIALSCLAYLQTAAGQELQQLRTALAAPANAQPIGRMPSSQQLRLALTLRLSNQDQLRGFLAGLYDPTSANYRQFLTVQQFREQFAPTVADYQRVIDWSRSHGLRIVNTAPNRLVLDVAGPVAAIESTFHVKMHIYRHPSENRTYYAPNIEPFVDIAIPVQGISGLNTFAPPRPMGLEQASSAEIAHSNTTGSGPGGSFLGSDMRAAYYGKTTLTGAGQTVGLFEFGPYNLSDVKAYFSSAKQALRVPIVNELLDGVSGICGAGCDDGEEVIDIEQAISMAPGLSAVIVYEGNNDTDMFNQMATDNIAKQLSVSFGWLPADPQSDEPIFEEFAAQGQNVFVASGDGGAYFGNPTDCQNFSNLNGCIFYPADDPLITAAGGTDLTTTGPGGAWRSETGWIGSGGGFSTNGFRIPIYQAPVINGSNQGSTTLRNLPDVAAEANTDNFFCANGGCFIGVGGTSLSGPRWAGFLALANEQADGVPIGFLNPTLYLIGLGPDYDSDLHDIVVGNNFNSGSPSLFSDVVGYDLVTGWGSPHGQALIDALGPASSESPNFVLEASPRKLTLREGEKGTSTITISGVNGFTQPVELRVTVPGAPAGVKASIRPSSLPGSGLATLNVSTTTSTPGGNFLIAITGTSNALTHTVYVTLATPGFELSSPNNVFLNESSTASAAIAITDINGFTGSVQPSLSALPKGVTAAIEPENGNRQKIVFQGTALADTGFTSVTVTGTSGKIKQTTTFTLAISAALGTAGVGTEVDLSPAFNVHGIYKDGSTYSTGGLDGGGFSYSANLLTPSRVLDLIRFKFGPSNQLNAIGGGGQTINLPQGQYFGLVLLGTGVEGSQTSQTIIVHYSDGTRSQFVQSFSDWFFPQNFPGEFEAVAMSHRNFADGSEDNRIFNLYAYEFGLDSTKTVESITLPNNRDVVILAATLVGVDAQSF